MTATPTEIATWLREGRAFAFDANAIFGNRRFLALCNMLNAIDLRRPDGPRVRKLVAAPVHMEKLHDMRQRLGERYDPRKIVDGLRSKGIEIVPFTVDHAEHAAGRLASHYPDRSAWHAFKRKRCLDCLGLAGHAASQAAAGSGKQCGATIDWLVAAHADADGCMLVTDDHGPEFAELDRIARLADAAEAAQRVRAELEAATAGTARRPR